VTRVQKMSELRGTLGGHELANYRGKTAWL
jgi:hypothetical protein